MPTCNILSHSMIFETWDLQKWGDLCCWQQPDITYEDFLTGLTETYNSRCLTARVFSDYSTRLYVECLSGASSSHTHTTDSYWSANTDGSISTSGYSTVVAISGLTSLGNDLHIKDDQFIYFGAEADSETRIRRTSNNLKIEAADDILILPDDDLKIGVGGSQYAVFDGGTTSLIVGGTSIPGAKLTVTAPATTYPFVEAGGDDGAESKAYINLLTAQASTMNLVVAEPTLPDGNHVFHIFPTPTSLPNDSYSCDIVLGGYKAEMEYSNEVLRIDGSGGRVGIKNTTPSYDLDVTGDIRCTDDLVVDDFASLDSARIGTTQTDPGTGNLYVEGDLEVDGTTNLDNTDIDGTLTVDGGIDLNATLLDIDASTGVAIDGPLIAISASTTCSINNANTTNGITIGTTTASVPISIGNTTSETTINDNLTVTGDATIPTRKYELPSSTAGDFKGGDIYYYGDGSTVKGSIYYINGTNWTLADADTVAASTTLLAVALGTDPDVDGMLLRGFVTLLTEIEGVEAIGSVLYLSATDTGIATITAPANSTEIVRVIGYSLHATNNQIYFNPDGTWVQLA